MIQHMRLSGIPTQTQLNVANPRIDASECESNVNLSRHDVKPHVNDSTYEATSQPHTTCARCEANPQPHLKSPKCEVKSLVAYSRCEANT